MIIDITGTILTPGNLGRDCLGNGGHLGFPCCCNECDYMLCCLEAHDPATCIQCQDEDCPRRLGHRTGKRKKYPHFRVFSVRRWVAFVKSALYNRFIQTKKG